MTILYHPFVPNQLQSKKYSFKINYLFGVCILGLFLKHTHCIIWAANSFVETIRETCYEVLLDIFTSVEVICLVKRLYG